MLAQQRRRTKLQEPPLAPIQQLITCGFDSRGGERKQAAFTHRLFLTDAKLAHELRPTAQHLQWPPERRPQTKPNILGHVAARLWQG